MNPEARWAQLDERTTLMRRDISEIKTELRRLDDKIEAVKQSLAALRSSIPFVNRK
jgi:prefoldin subunit 5